jgi:hypothetical protein
MEGFQPRKGAKNAKGGSFAGGNKGNEEPRKEWDYVHEPAEARSAVRDRCGSDQVNDDVDVATYGFRIRTGLVRGVCQGLSHFAIQTRQTDVEARLEGVSAVGQTQVHFGVNGQVSRDLDFHFAGRKPYRPFEAGGPTGGEQLLGVGAGARAARNRMLNVQAAIRTAGRAAVTTARGMDFGGVQHFFELGARVNFFGCFGGIHC